MESKTVNKWTDDPHLRRMIENLLLEADRKIKNTIFEKSSISSSTKQAMPSNELLDYTEEKLVELQQAHHERAGRGIDVSNEALLHSYLTKCLKDHLSSCIRDELSRVRDRFGVADLHDTLISMCCKRIMESPHYQAFKKAIRATIEDAAERVTQDYCSSPFQMPDCPAEIDLEESAWSFYDTGNSVHLPVANCQVDCDSSSVASSSDGGGAACWLVLSSERLEELAERLDSRHAPAVRLEALRTLSSLPVAELVTFDSWPYLKQQLVDILSGSSSNSATAAVFEASLHLHSKMLLSTSSRCAAESYTNLVAALYYGFETLWYSSRVVPTRLDPVSCRPLLQITKLINVFQKAIPNYWIRFPEQHSCTIVEFTIRYLMDDATDGVARWQSDDPTPFHLLGLIDPEAIWFRNWMRAEYGRRLVFHELHLHTDLLPDLVAKCLLGFELLGSSQDRPPSARKVMQLDDRGLPHSYVEYCCLLQVVAILGWVMFSAEGRHLLDAQLNSAGRKLTSRQLLATMLITSTEIGQATGVCNRFCASRCIVDIFRRLIEQETSCQYYFGDDSRPIRTILDQLQQWCDGPPDQIYNISSCELHWLRHMTDILFHLSDSVVALPIVSGSNAPIVASFTEHLLLISKDAVIPSDGCILEDIKMMALKVCCRVFTTHSGVEILCHTQLLHKIAEEWESMLRDADHTPVPGTATSDKQSSDRAREWLQELSAIGSTPLGLTALHKADLLQDVLNWAEKELRDGIQFVSLTIPTRLMLSQLAAVSDTKLGFADPSSSSVEFIAENIWKACECRCTEDTASGSLPLTDERLELYLSQTMSGLTCILPSYITIKSLLPPSLMLDETMSSATAVSMLARLVISGVEGSFANAELIYEAGVHLLCLLATSLDTWLHLDSRYLLQEALLKAQQLNALEDTGQLIIDNVFISRNYLLAKTAEIGGESEKLLPPNVFDQEGFDVESVLQWPMVVSLPISEKYLPILPPLSSPPLEIELFLKESRLENLDQEWLTYCREVYRNCLTSKERVQLRGKWFGHLLYYALETVTGKTGGIPANANAVIDEKPFQLSRFTEIGVTLTVRYGIRLGLLNSEEVATRNLTTVLVGLQSESDIQVFDWITATVFVLMSGDPTRTLTFRKYLKALPVEVQMTSCRRPATPERFSTAWLNFCHNVEVVLQGDLPLVAYALQWSGLCVGHVCQPWISQCFWNILDWEEICNYFGLCLLIGEDFLVYFVVALFRHLQTEIIHHAKDGDMPIFLRETRVEGFRTKDYLPFMDHLESKYHDILRHTMQELQ